MNDVLAGDVLAGDDAIAARVASTSTWPLWLWLGAPVAVLLAAALLRVGGGRQVLLPWVDVAIPETCAMYARTGFDCPGCGLTRSFIHIAHARPWVAWQVNPISWPLFAFTAAQIPIALLHLRRHKLASLPWIDVVNQSLMMGIMSIMVLRWIIHMVWGAWIA